MRDTIETVKRLWKTQIYKILYIFMTAGLFLRSEHSSQMALTSTLVSFKHVHCFYLMRKNRL